MEGYRVCARLAVEGRREDMVWMDEKIKLLF